eukprot:6181510-Pleurochrysis_carterae.AAC.3
MFARQQRPSALSTRTVPASLAKRRQRRWVRASGIRAAAAGPSVRRAEATRPAAACVAARALACAAAFAAACAAACAVACASWRAGWSWGSVRRSGLCLGVACRRDAATGEAPQRTHGARSTHARHSRSASENCSPLQAVTAYCSDKDTSGRKLCRQATGRSAMLHSFSPAAGSGTCDAGREVLKSACISLAARWGTQIADGCGGFEAGVEVDARRLAPVAFCWFLVWEAGRLALRMDVGCDVLSRRWLILPASAAVVPPACLSKGFLAKSTPSSVFWLIFGVSVVGLPIVASAVLVDARSLSPSAIPRPATLYASLLCVHDPRLRIQAKLSA